MLRFVWYAHSGVRYLVLLAGLALVIACVLGLAIQKPGPRAARVMGAIFVGLLDLQFLLGLGLIGLGRFTPRATGHLVLTVAAVAVAHRTHVQARKREGGTYTWRLGGALAALLLITLGILSIGRGLFQSTAW
jgi:hypothetical protein